MNLLIILSLILLTLSLSLVLGAVLYRFFYYSKWWIEDRLFERRIRRISRRLKGD